MKEARFEKKYYQKNFGSFWNRKLFTRKELHNIIESADDDFLVAKVWRTENKTYENSKEHYLKIYNVAQHLEQEYSLERITEVEAHIYSCYNVKKDHPFGIHFDVNDNIIVQCEGRTNFKVWDRVEDITQTNYRMYMKSLPILDVDMKSGDAIWIPRYYPHLATSKTRRLSISFCYR